MPVSWMQRVQMPLHMVSCTVLSTFKFLIILKQGALHFHFTLIPKIYITGETKMAA